MSERQSKRASLVEAVVNTFAGLIFSFGIQKLLNHTYDVEMSNTVAAHFVFWFTVASVVRSYIIRRLWTNEWWRAIVRRFRPAPTGTTKACPECYCKDLILLTSLNTKICSQCGIEIPWYLEKGQKPLLIKTRK